MVRKNEQIARLQQESGGLQGVMIEARVNPRRNGRVRDLFLAQTPILPGIRARILRAEQQKVRGRGSPRENLERLDELENSLVRAQEAEVPDHELSTQADLALGPVRGPFGQTWDALGNDPHRVFDRVRGQPVRVAFPMDV